MIPEHYKELIEMLRDQTDVGSVNWKSSARKGTFVVDFSGKSLSVDTYTRDFTQRKYVCFTLLGPEGDEIDDFTVGENEPDWGLADELYKGARRKAHNIDAIIGDIAAELKSESRGNRDS